MELSEEQSTALACVRRHPQEALSLLSVDLAAEGCTMDGVVAEVAARGVTLVSVVNTKLNSGVARRASAWPNFGHVRADSVCGGMTLYYSQSLRVEELPALASAAAPGVWVTVSAPESQARPTVVGVLSCTEDTVGLEQHIAESVAKVRERFGEQVALVVGGNRALERGEDTPEVLEGLEWRRVGPGQFLLHSSQLELQPEALESLGGGALLCTLRSHGCTVCRLALPSEEALVEHRRGNHHRRSLILNKLRRDLPDLTKSPHALGLELGLEVGSVATQATPGMVEVVTRPGVPVDFKLLLRNVREAPPEEGKVTKGVVVVQVAVPSCRWGEQEGPDGKARQVQVGAGGVIELTDDHGVTGDQDTKIRIKHTKKYRVGVRCLGTEVGEHRVPIVILFYHDVYSKELPRAEGDEEEVDRVISKMAVEVVVKVRTPELETMLPLEPYTARPKGGLGLWRSRETVKGQLPPTVFEEEEDHLVVKLPLPNTRMGEARSKLIASRLQGGADTVEERRQLEKMRGLLEGPLDAANYAERFQLLLHCEQWQEERDIMHYDMEAVELRLERSSGLVVLEVPGLQEGRPTVLRGDKLFLRESGSNRMVEFEGFVHQVGGALVWLGCSDRLAAKLQAGAAWDVRFTVSNHPARHMHRAVKLAQITGLTAGCLFPTAACLATKASRPTLACFNTEVATNPEQRAAVQAIVSGLSGAAPYIVFGPPGTGKTVTLVESIKQVWLHNQDSHILAVAPSNTATDLLAERLAMDIPAAEMIRLHANSRARASIPAALEGVSNLREGGYTFPCLTALSKYRVVVTTLVTAGRLASAQFPQGHFGHIFIDEAAQATEPEAVIALAGLISQASLTGGGQVVMAGDPRQLGPIVRSSIATENGFAVPLIERLMALPLYSREAVGGGYDGRCITKLVRNFRSHPKLLQLPATLFYNGELQACAPAQVVNSCLAFSGLTEEARGRIPLLFHGVVGEDLREAASPSFFNPAEAVVVLDYVAALVAEGVRPADIGVITPYRRQVQKLRERLEVKGWREEVMVGTTEEFQGQERRVMLLTTVRSSSEFLLTDAQHKLGFLANPKRFNVAVTRARALLVVVGNPHILEHDREWRALLEYCLQHRAYRGTPYPREQQEEAQDKLAGLLLDQSEQARLEETGWNPKAV